MMQILLTNDDGFSAPGLHAAYNALRGLGIIHVVAPLVECSACSHTITLGQAIAVERRIVDPYGTIYTVDGTPADCVRLAVAELMDQPIDLLISGVNRGANTGVDLYYSGTVAGAREGAILHIPSIAVSQALARGVDTDWDAATDITAMIVRDLLREELPGPGFWNVNLPAPIPPNARDRIRRAPVELAPAPFAFERTEANDGRLMQFRPGGSYWQREASPRSDYAVLRDGDVSITAVSLGGSFS